MEHQHGLHETLGSLGIEQHRFAAWFNVAPRSARRWLHGSRRLPLGVAALLQLAVDGRVSVDDIEAAVAATQTNGGAQPDPEMVAPLAASTGPNGTIEDCAPEVPSGPEPVAEPEQVDPAPEAGVGFLQLNGSRCRWPMWAHAGKTPATDRQRYCGCPTASAGQPYCRAHAEIAYEITRSLPRARAAAFPRVRNGNPWSAGRNLLRRG